MNVTKEHFLSEQAFAEYKQGIDWFYSELVRLNTTIFFLERIFEFPFNLFGFYRSNFFLLLVQHFVNAAVLIITRLLSDQQGDNHTFLRFKNRFNQLMKPQYHPELHQRMRAIRLDTSTNNDLATIKELRNQYIAHLSRDLVHGNVALTPFDLTLLKRLRDKLNQWFEVLALKDGTQYMLVPLEYAPNVSRPGDSRPDIETILDNIARNSPLLNMPEENPGLWQEDRERFTEEEIAQINRYRRKFGLPEA